MTVNRQHFREEMGALSPWHCPRCAIGTLQELAKERAKVWPHWSSIEHGEDWWEAEHAKFRFSAQMKCNNGHCGECVFVIGQMVPTYYGDDEEGPHYADDFQVRAVYPAVPVFRLSADWPATVSWRLHGPSGRFGTTQEPPLIDCEPPSNACSITSR